MRQWEIYDFPYPTDNNPHPCVVISPDLLAQSNSSLVNVLACTSLSVATARPTDVPLDKDDDLDHLSVAKCQLILTFNKSQAGKRHGEVSMERRRQIGRKLIELMGLLDPIPPQKVLRRR